MDLLLYIAFRSFVAVLRLFPHSVQLSCVETILRAVVYLFPRHRRVAQKNIALVFPDLPKNEREDIFRSSFREIARLLVDALRVPTLDKSWYEEHVVFPKREKVLDILSQGKGALLAVGHLGSFELLAQAFCVRCQPLHLVIRSFQSPQVDRWWNRMREWNGNRIVRRDGAFREIIRQLQSGSAVALPFDQNLRRNFAVFVHFFGRPAATTRALGLAALASKAPVLVGSLTCLANDRYRIEWVECPTSDIYENDSWSKEEKQLLLTQRVSDIYAEMIRKNPAAWFWMHRRWKTTPEEGMPEDFYTLP
jgi:KDO2-lipid IV(A) lauroyltransferase